MASSTHLSSPGHGRYTCRKTGGAVMATPTISISEASHRVLRELAEQTDQTMGEVLERALDDYRRKVFFQGLAADFAALKADPEAWADELEERRLWEATLTDGLDPDERWTEDDHCLDPESPGEEKA